MRVLTEAQHDRLDRIADRLPRARVVGWSVKVAGPVVRTPRGYFVVVLPGGHARRTRLGGLGALA